ncbi:MAG: tripartite tricarboxylate transporter TctB family protein [Kiloniellaceae bacterium]
MKATATGPERLRDALAGVALLSFALVLWFVLIPFYAGGHGGHVIVAEIAGILIGALAVLLLVFAAYGIPTASGSAGDDDPFLEMGAGREPPKLLVLGGIWGIYVVGLYFLGFYVSGFLAVAASIALLGIRRPLVIGACALGTILGCYLVFEWGFKLSLPRGQWIEFLLASST